MSPQAWVLVALVVVLAIVAVALYADRRRSQQLRERFGPEYDRQVSDLGDRRRAERVLRSRAERVDRLRIKPLSQQDRDRFADAWQRAQALFVDDPARAIADADGLVTEVMRLRGYPMSDFEQRAQDISVDHPQVVENYRAAVNIARRSARGEASTEERRQAMVHYRSLFDDLLRVEPQSDKEVHRWALKAH